MDKETNNFETQDTSMLKGHKQRLEGTPQNYNAWSEDPSVSKATQQNNSENLLDPLTDKVKQSSQDMLIPEGSQSTHLKDPLSNKKTPNTFSNASFLIKGETPNTTKSQKQSERVSIFSVALQSKATKQDTKRLEETSSIANNKTKLSESFSGVNSRIKSFAFYSTNQTNQRSDSKESSKMVDQRTPWPFAGASPQLSQSDKQFTQKNAVTTMSGSFDTQKGMRNEPMRQDIVSITYEEIGFFPRSFSRVFDRFLKQVFSDVDNLVIQEYRFYRYLFLTTLKCLLILFFVPFIVNYLSKTYLISPLTEYFWNTQQTEIFLNSYQQKRAFTELKDFEEKLYFESLLHSGSKTNRLEEVSALTKAKLEKTKNSNSSLVALRSKATEQQETSDVTNITSINLNPLNNVTSIADENSQSLLLDLQNQALKPPVAQQPCCEVEQQKLVVLSLPEEQRQVQKTETTSKNLNPIPVTSIAEENKHILGKNPVYNTASVGVSQKSNRQEIFEQRLQEKTIELAIRYNNQSIEAITNFFADLISFITLCYLLVALEIQINITKSFLLEVFFGLDDGKKSLLILLITDLLVGYHSSNLWELFFEFLFNHYGLPESQTGIFLLVATLPVLLDVLFKYLIFRHLNRSSPATVATYHAIIE